MADFVAFTEGRRWVAENGLPHQCQFLLATKAVDDIPVEGTLRSVGEVQGDGYRRLDVSRPPASGNPLTLNFPQLTWSTGVNTGWPSEVRTCVLATTDGVAVAAWNLRPGGLPRDMSEAATTEQFSPTLTVQ